MTTEYSVNAYESNQVNLYAVQGESDSRTIVFKIIEKSGVVAATSNAVPVNKMLDLTGFTVALCVFNGFQKIICLGTVADPENGVVEFLLDPEMTLSAGKMDCVIEITKEEIDLRIIGITLDVKAVSGFSTIVIYRNTVYAAAVCIADQGEHYILGETEKLIFEVRHGENIILQKELTNAEYNDDEKGYILSLSSDETDISPGTYYYKIRLKRADGEFETVIPKKEFIIEE
ncbi:MAG: BppU family phage baseplate upper protein [Clostridia bacterium]|nr:BppU family phage baseplate upper protein [Clostridia bacterium]MBR2176131.1 BppU family phage baseplate upper protein [Clostridia bacterium]